MSIGYNISHQHVGLSRTGRFRESVRHMVPASCRNSGVTRPDDRATDHSRWRRISGITCAVEDCLTPKQRRAGIARLVERMKIFALTPQEPLAQPTADDESNAEDARLAAPSPGAEAPPSPHGGEGKKLDFVREWEFGIETWARVGQEGRSVEGLCALFQISRARLTALTKEFCGLSAQEMLDGFKIRRLKQLMAERLRSAAEKLWGGPGDLAFLRACMPTEESLTGPGAARRSEKALRGGRRYHAQVPDFYGQDIGEERENRKAALVAELKRDADFEGAAVRLGFGSAARMNRACLNVFGRSLRELESFLAGDVVMYYLTAEVKYLREMASRDTNGLSSRDVQATYRAREFYDGSEDAPTAPYCDLWSAAEHAKANWLEAMAAAFG